MLLRRVLLRLPDRPGSLGQVTTLMGRLGIDIHQVRVLVRNGAVATDEFVVGLPGPVLENCLVELLEELNGVRVLGTWVAGAGDGRSDRRNGASVDTGSIE
jgi:hypothetical protein